MDGRASHFVSMIFGNSPYLLGLVLGVVVAIMGWTRAPKAAMAVLGGVVISGFGWFLSPFVSTLLGYGGASSMMVFTILNFLSNICQGAGLVFICAAAFIDRRAPDPLDRP